MNNFESVQKIEELLRIIDTKRTKVSNLQSFPQNLTTPAINILLVLNKQGQMRVSDIGSELNMVDSNVSTICTRLEKMGFVERIRLKDDQRVVRVQLTETAQGEIENILASISECNEMLLKHTSNEDLDKILDGLTILEQLFDNVLKDKSGN